MKRLLTAALGAACLLLSPAAFAQQWSGPNIGIEGGYGWGTGSGSVVPGAAPTIPFDFNTNGGLGGLRGGYNFQWGPYVLGVDGDIEGGDISGSQNLGGGATLSNKIDITGSLRGKLGFAIDRFLIYGTGGVAAGDVHSTLQTPTFTTTPNEIRVGWTAGGGIEYAVDRHWELGLEYRYTDLGNDRVVNVTHGFTYNSAVKFSLAQVALTYRFAPPPAPPPMVEPAPMPVVAPATPPPPPPRSFLVFFDFDKYTLTPDARHVVEAAAAAFKATGHARIELAGYTDLAGTQAYNLRLSQHRADAVAGYLAEQGVPKHVMDVKWFGKEHPRVPTPDGVREPQNRRVEIVMP